ncbi:hypothetical protein IZ6_11030 [Terrihabitans soli]|uniref:Uncharacterized protein n=1 Tax=Terrihabitans soli TaxID=708113 RepID=A0A6S6QV31_9HYPH|nr:hypothetical protein [Terrihabitans soli]BCJ90368.1 hypothetical protein IZ6_11030 [Terrihabitans soli]
MYTGTFGPASNRADYRETIQLRTADDANFLEIEEIEIVVGNPNRCAALRKLLSQEQISYDEELGEFTFILKAEELRGFSAGTYDMGIVLTIEGAREQLFTGEIVILDGVVS